MQVGQQIAELIVGELRGRHHAASMQDCIGEPLVRGRRAGGHGLDLGDGLQARPVQRTCGGGVMAAGALLMKDLRAARFFDGPKGLGLGGGQRTAAAERDSQQSGESQRG